MPEFYIYANSWRPRGFHSLKGGSLEVDLTLSVYKMHTDYLFGVFQTSIIGCKWNGAECLCKPPATKVSAKLCKLDEEGKAVQI